MSVGHIWKFLFAFGLDYSSWYMQRYTYRGVVPIVKNVGQFKSMSSVGVCVEVYLCSRGVIVCFP